MKSMAAEIDRNLTCHELARLFPELEPDQFAALREDIREHGLQHPIVVDRGGKIIDGRHRYRALVELQSEYREKLQGAELSRAIRRLGFRTRVVEPDSEADFALSSNLARRHLSPSQRCMIVAKSQLNDASGHRKPGINVSDLARRYGLQRVTLYKAEYVLRKCEEAVALVNDPKRQQELRDLPQLVIEGKRSVGVAEQQIAEVLGARKLARPGPAQDLPRLARELAGKVRGVADDEQALVAIAPLLLKLEKAISDLPPRPAVRPRGGRPHKAAHLNG